MIVAPALRAETWAAARGGWWRERAGEGVRGARGSLIVERKSCERAGRLVRGDADEEYTDIVNVKFFSATLLFSLSLCLPLLFVGTAKRAGVERSKLVFHRRVRTWVKGILGRVRSGGREMRARDTGVSTRTCAGGERPVWSYWNNNIHVKAVGNRPVLCHKMSFWTFSQAGRAPTVLSTERKF